jgi:hypothetical protein
VKQTGVPAPLTVYVVCGSRGVEQVFTDSAAAHRFADGLPGCWVSQHVLRNSDEEAAVVVDRRVVVVAGETRTDTTKRSRCFTDESFTMPAADVEWFCDETTGEWHIVGFGTDDAALDALMRQAVEQVLELSSAAPAGPIVTPERPAAFPPPAYLMNPYMGWMVVADVVVRWARQRRSRSRHTSEVRMLERIPVLPEGWDVTGRHVVRP